MFFKKKKILPDKDVIFNITKNLFTEIPDLSEKNISSLTITENKISLILSIPKYMGNSVKNIEDFLKSEIIKKYPSSKLNIIFTNDVVKPETQKSSTPKPPTPKSVDGIKKIIAVASGKGGVGKSTIATHLALTYAKLGFKTGLADADIHGPSIARMMGITNEPEIQNNKMIPPERFGVKCMSMGFLLSENAPVVWRGPMVTKALHQLMLGADWGDLDVLIIDLPPGTGDIQLSLAQNYKIDGVILVSTPQEIALMDVKKAATMFNKVNIPILGIIENMAYFTDKLSGNRAYIFGKGAIKKFCDESNIKYLGEVPLNSKIAENCDMGEHNNPNEINALFEKFINENLF